MCWGLTVTVAQHHIVPRISTASEEVILQLIITKHTAS